jgi:hypothetical protein
MQAKPPEWLGVVKGFVTLGSPIDKHNLIWGENFPADIPKEQAEKIKWWNFWDYSDPVGHSLDGIFGGGNRENNQFRRIFDAGYWRYPIPGKAHVDYWKDINLHHKVIQEVIQIPAGYEAGQRKVEDRLWGKLKWPGPGDFVAYGLARAAEVAALLYYLSRLLRPVREWKAIAAWLDGAKTWPLPSLPQTNMAIWTLGAAWIWKLVWDNPLSVAKQDEMLNLRQLRWERVAMSLWGLVLIYVSLNIDAPKAEGINDEIGWAMGLVTTALIWKLHAAVHKGLVQWWRYGRGGTQFLP